MFLWFEGDICLTIALWAQENAGESAGASNPEDRRTAKIERFKEEKQLAASMQALLHAHRGGRPDAVRACRHSYTHRGEAGQMR